MKLTPVDWAIVASYFALSTGVGLYFTRRSRMSPNCQARAVASPDSPGRVIAVISVQSITPSGILLSFKGELLVVGQARAI